MLLGLIERRYLSLLSRIRVLYLRLKGVRLGRNCYVGKGVTIVGNVSIGDGTTIGDMTIISTMPDGSLTIGKDCHINSFNVLGAATNVSIGDHCIFAAFVHITDATHEYDTPEILIKNAPIYGAPVTIGKNVWLGSGAMVLKGVSIGDGTVIGAKALVNKSIPANSVAVGIPCRPIKSR